MRQMAWFCGVNCPWLCHWMPSPLRGRASSPDSHLIQHGLHENSWLWAFHEVTWQTQTLLLRATCAFTLPAWDNRSNTSGPQCDHNQRVMLALSALRWTHRGPRWCVCSLESHPNGKNFLFLKNQSSHRELPRIHQEILRGVLIGSDPLYRWGSRPWKLPREKSAEAQGWLERGLPGLWWPTPFSVPAPH